MKKTNDEKYKDVLKDSEIAEDLAEIKDYLHKHPTKAFMELALGAFADGQMHDSNYSLALLAQESKYDVISCLWVIIFKCNQLLKSISTEVIPQMDLLVSLMNMVEQILAKYSILIDEGKLETANRFFVKDKKILKDVIAAIEAGVLDKVDKAEDKKND